MYVNELISKYCLRSALIVRTSHIVAFREKLRKSFIALVCADFTHGVLLFHPSEQRRGRELREAGEGFARGILVNDKGFGNFIGRRLRHVQPFRLGEKFSGNGGNGRGVHIEYSDNITFLNALTGTDIEIYHIRFPPSVSDYSI